MRVAVLDSGEWVHNLTNQSSPRPYAVFNEMGVRVAQIGHLPSLDENARDETHPILHEKAKWVAEHTRIMGAQNFYNATLIEELHSTDFISNLFENKDLTGAKYHAQLVGAVRKWVCQGPDVDAVLIAMRPSETRNAIVKQTAALQKPILLHPPGFNSIEELRKLRKALQKDKREALVTLYTPRRYARGVQEARKRIKKWQGISTGSMEMGSGRYPHAKRWLTEFCSHFYDCLFNLIMSPKDFSHIEIQASCAITQSPAISFTGICHPDAQAQGVEPLLCSALISAHRGWQIGSHVDINITGGHRQYLRIASNLSESTQYSQQNSMAEVSDFSHDVSHAVLFGGQPLLEEFFDSEYTPQTPRLETYEITQNFTDLFAELLSKAEDAEKVMHARADLFYVKNDNQWNLRKKFKPSMI